MTRHVFAAELSVAELSSQYTDIRFVVLCSQKYDITLVSPRNYFLYTPLLPAVATGTVEERSIVEPIRRIMAGKVLLAFAFALLHLCL